MLAAHRKPDKDGGKNFKRRDKELEKADARLFLNELRLFAERRKNSVLIYLIRVKIMGCCFKTFSGFSD